MPLILRIRFHEGRCHAMRSAGVPEWPPSPARLFQALVAAAAEGAVLPEAERAALAWLETLSPPTVLAPPARELKAFSTYVPNNDLDAVSKIETVGGNPAAYIQYDDGWKPAASKIRTPKTIAPVSFNASLPLTYVWPDAGPCPEAERIIAIAARVFQLGRGVDPAWGEGSLAEAVPDAVPGLLRYQPCGAGAEGWAVPVPGSLTSLEQRHAGFLQRLATTHRGRKAETLFTNPPKPRFGQVRYGAPPLRLCYDIRDGSGHRFHAIPAAGASVLVDRLIQRAARRLGNGPEVQRLLVGVGAGPADIDVRIRLIALPTQRRHVDRAIRRVLVEVPQLCPLPADDIDWAFSGLSPLDPEHDPETGEVQALLVKASDTTMADAYAGLRAFDGADGSARSLPARLWRSETPLALPDAARRRIDPAHRVPKPGTERASEEETATRAVRTALRQAGVETAAFAIRVQREPFAAQGTRAEDFAEGTRFSGHSLWHAEIRFAAPLTGPLVLGNGRFRGLGLMAPVADTPPPGFGLAIRAGLTRADAEALSHALRRAVLALAGQAYGKNEIPGWFSGHQPDGRPLRDDGHAHLAFAADLARGRLLVLAPHGVGHRSPDRGETGWLDRLGTMLAMLTDLRAGACGALSLAATPLDPDDPLLAPATVWESVTEFRPTRHPKDGDVTSTLHADIRRELLRRNLPMPQSIDITEATTGPRGGLTARARLTFARAVPGPILLGRTMHEGGGLFGPAAGMASDNARPG